MSTTLRGCRAARSTPMGSRRVRPLLPTLAQAPSGRVVLVANADRDGRDEAELGRSHGVAPVAAGDLRPVVDVDPPSPRGEPPGRVRQTALPQCGELGQRRLGPGLLW